MHTWYIPKLVTLSATMLTWRRAPSRRIQGRPDGGIYLVAVHQASSTASQHSTRLSYCTAALAQAAAQATASPQATTHRRVLGRPGLGMSRPRPNIARTAWHTAGGLVDAAAVHDAQAHACTHEAALRQRKSTGAWRASCTARTTITMAVARATQGAM